jgi:hypothetical protein
MNLDDIIKILEIVTMGITLPIGVIRLCQIHNAMTHRQIENKKAG